MIYWTSDPIFFSLVLKNPLFWSYSNCCMIALRTSMTALRKIWLDTYFITAVISKSKWGISHKFGSVMLLNHWGQNNPTSTLSNQKLENQSEFSFHSYRLYAIHYQEHLYEKSNSKVYKGWNKSTFISS